MLTTYHVSDRYLQILSAFVWSQVKQGKNKTLLDVKALKFVAFKSTLYQSTSIEMTKVSIHPELYD